MYPEIFIFYTPLCTNDLILAACIYSLIGGRINHKQQPKRKASVWEVLKSKIAIFNLFHL